MKTSLLVASWAVWVALAIANQGRFDDDAEKSSQAPSVESLQACDGLPDGASCSFSLDEGEVRGVCLPALPARPAACVPRAVLTRLE